VSHFSNNFESSSVAMGTFVTGPAGGGTEDKTDNTAPAPRAGSLEGETSYALWCGPPAFNDFARAAMLAVGYKQQNGFEF
jgi:hypothetical protein